MIYLDHNATTPVDPRVRDGIAPFLTTTFGNPSSSHTFGRQARTALDESRSQVARALGADPTEIVFTSGGTESNHLALLGSAWTRGGGHIILSAVEHPSVLEPARWLEKQGYELTILPVDRDGRVNAADLEAALRPDTFIVSVMHANNEVGTVQPVEEIGRFLREQKILFHVDAAQSVGKIPVDVTSIDADLLSIAGHKVYAPKGIGALYVRRGTNLSPLFRGGGQERGLRAGTENTALAAGLGIACSLAASEGWSEQMAEATARLWSILVASVPAVRRNGSRDHCLPNTLHVTFPGVAGKEVLEHLDGNVAASAGSACHSDDQGPSGVLGAMGRSATEALESVRFSTGKDSSLKDIDQAGAAIIRAINRAIDRKRPA